MIRRMNVRRGKYQNIGVSFVQYSFPSLAPSLDLCPRSCGRCGIDLSSCVMEWNISPAIFTRRRSVSCRAEQFILTPAALLAAIFWFIFTIVPSSYHSSGTGDASRGRLTVEWFACCCYRLESPSFSGLIPNSLRIAFIWPFYFQSFFLSFSTAPEADSVTYLLLLP